MPRITLTRRHERTRHVGELLRSWLCQDGKHALYRRQYHVCLAAVTWGPLKGAKDGAVVAAVEAALTKQRQLQYGRLPPASAHYDLHAYVRTRMF